jgi:cell fate regulator YaaT (PSP1 superfamily)
MSDVICLISERTAKIIRVQKGDFEVRYGDLCVVESEFGGDLATVVDVASDVCRHLKNAGVLPRIIRLANEDDTRKFSWLLDKEQRAFAFCQQRIKERGLAMKLTAIRFFFNEKKGIFFYTADGRIDFRQLVKDLAKELKMRIEMRQIGVRDEAKIIGGLGVCGRPLCCVSFMTTFEPVTIQKARKQQIVINPTKISGLCGRLMCCLAFEEEGAGRMYYENESTLIED